MQINTFLYNNWRSGDLRPGPPLYDQAYKLDNLLKETTNMALTMGATTRPREPSPSVQKPISTPPQLCGNVTRTYV